MDPVERSISPLVGEAFRFGDWVAEPARHVLRRDESAIHIEPRVMAVLCCLAASAGRVVTRDELFERVWDNAAVNDEALSRAVSALRKALGDDPLEPLYVETIRKSGYRLIAPVAPVACSRERSRPLPKPLARWIWMLLAGGVGLVALLFVDVARRSREAPHDPSGGPIARPLTTFPGREIDPAISPDGQRVVFAWNGAPDAGDYELYVKQVQGEATLRLTRVEGFEGHPVWSPDGSEIAFVREQTDGRAAVMAVPAVGGAERKIADLAAWSYGLDWSPDGRWLAISEAVSNAPPAIVLVATDGSERRVVTRPDTLYQGDFKPVFAADSNTLAFVRAERIGVQDIYLVELDRSTPPRRLTRQQHRVRGLDWTPNGQLVVCWDRSGSFGLWQVDPTDGEMRFVAIPGPHVFNPSVAADGRIVAEAVSLDRDVWQLDLDGGATGPGRALIQSTRQEIEAAYSPDGEHIGFVSDRTGVPQLWRSAADGSDALQLSDSTGGGLGKLHWAPRGDRIAFFAAPAGFAELRVVDAAGGPVETLVSGSFHAVPATWTRDGRDIVYASDRGGTWELWRVPARGGESSRITRNGGFLAATTADGALVFSRFDDPGLWVLRGDQAQAEPYGVDVPTDGLWRLTSDGEVVVTGAVDDNPVEVFRVERPTGQLRSIARLSGWDPATFALSPSGPRLLYGRFARSDNDLMLVEPIPDFR